MIEFFETYQIGFYLCFFLLPFLQEDVSILGAASACASGLGNPFLGFFLVALGLTVSASLKYGLGRAATSRAWARKYAENPKILKAGDSVKGNLGKSLYMARFVSAVRIPFMSAQGFSRLASPNSSFSLLAQRCSISPLLLGYFMFSEKLRAISSRFICRLSLWLSLSCILLFRK